ncbi:NEDD4-binding protein 2-like 1 [Engraulis encrasicolus]|uniref:NEDD4-binding protein 2-like 1 n=1 Tax=Engraulis encrasicolus TaxID=184585 RepID=UPI002FD279CF
MGRRKHPHRTKTLYILRGLPGTHKSDKARDIQDRLGGVIINADEYHRNKKGQLVIRPEKLNEGHIWARGQALQAMDEGMDPVIIDNTNMSWREMFPYVLMGFHRGYWIKFLLTKDTFRVSLDEIDRYVVHLDSFRT